MAEALSSRCSSSDAGAASSTSPPPSDSGAASSYSDRGPNVIVLSSAGKPIFSRRGHEEDLTAACGLVQAVRATAVEDETLRCGDIRSLRAGSTTVVFLTVGALTLLAVSDGDDCLGPDSDGGGDECGTDCDGERETEAYLRLQLEYVYSQIIFTLTDQVQNVFRRSPNFDLRNMLGATDAVMRGVLDRAGPLGNGGSFLTAGVETVCPIPHEIRENASHAILGTCDAHSDTTLFALLLVGSRLVTLVQPRYRPHQLHPSDLHLILNFVCHQPGLLTNELWFPVCLPRLNSSGFVYAYTSCLDPKTKLSLVLISQQNTTEQFELFRTKAIEIRTELGLPPPKGEGVIRIVNDAAKRKAALGADRDDDAELGESLTHFDDVAWQRGGASDDDDSAEDDEEDMGAAAAEPPASAQALEAAAAAAAGPPERGIRRFGSMSSVTSQLSTAADSAASGDAHRGSTLCKILTEIGRNRELDELVERYKSIASAHHFLFRIDVAVGDNTGGMLSQCLSPPVGPPFVDGPSKRRVWASYQRLSLRLRLGSAGPEASMDAFDMIAADHDKSESVGCRGVNPGIGADVPAQCLMESPPNVHGVTYVLDGSELFIGLNGRDFELYATLPGTVPPRNGTALCARLVRRLMNDEGRLFLAHPLTWKR